MGQEAGTAGTPARGLYTVRGMAEALGISKSECHRDKQAGMPMHSVEAARAWRAQTHDVSRSAEGRIDRAPLFEQSNGAMPAAASGAGAVAAPPAPAIAPAAPPQAPEDDQAEPGDTSEYRAARAAREQIRREREQLELDEIKGKLIDVEEAKRCAFTAFRSLRDAVLNVPARIKAQLAGESDPFRVEQLLEGELSAALAGFDVTSAVRDTEQDDDVDP